MKKSNIFLISIFFFVSCTVEPPKFIVKGVRLQSALLFLEEFQREKDEEGEFSHYVNHLRDNHAPGFSWSQYWSGITEKKLYENLKEEELNKLLSLSEVSCQQESMSAFTNLLLQIATADPKKILFSHQLNRLNKVCSTWLSNSTFKLMVQFLVNKRKEVEVEKIKQEKSDFFLTENARKGVSNRVTPSSHPRKNQKYLYTEELQKTLIDEWSRTQHVRVWSDILNVVDRAFWNDARWINYKENSREYLKRTLEMEWSAYQSIENLEQDIFLMFEEEDKMMDIISLAEYKRYFADYGSLNWSVIWEKFLLQYPQKPDNGNIQALLSLYSFSCQDQDLRSYFTLADHWNTANYKSLAIKFCVEVMGIENLAVNQYEILENTLKNDSNPKNLKSVDALLFVYEEEKYKRSPDEWKKLISYFSETDWLNLMGALRDRHDRKSIREVLHIHNQAYEGQITFLIKDIWSVFVNGEQSVLEIADEYGYDRAYVDNSYFHRLFWTEVEESSVHLSNPKESLREQEGTEKCDYSYVRNLFQFFNNSGQKNLLFDQFNFENCTSFVKDFRQREWNKIVNQIKKADWNLGSESTLKENPKNYEKYQFVQRLARVLSLYPYSLDTVIISQIDKKKWEDIILTLILSSLYLKESEFTDMDLFYDTAYRVNGIYQTVADSSVCRFLGYEKSHFLIQKHKYSVNMIKYLLTFYPSQQRSTHNRSRKHRKATNICDALISQERINTFLFLLAKFTLSPINLEEENNLQEIWKNVDELIHLFEEVNFFQLSSYQSNGLWRYLKNVPQYDAEKGHISQDSLGFYFMSLVFRKIQPVWLGPEKSDEILPPENEFNKVYRNLIKQMLQENDMNWEKELILLEEKLLLP